MITRADTEATAKAAAGGEGRGDGGWDTFQQAVARKIAETPERNGAKSAPYRSRNVRPSDNICANLKRQYTV